MKNSVREVRAARSWSQGDLAARLSVSRQTVNAIGTGKYDPSLPLAFKIARLFGLYAEEIFGSSHVRAPRTRDGEPGEGKVPTTVGRKTAWSSGAALLLLLSACGSFLEDNGTHLAYALEKGAARLRASTSPELVVRYETLDGGHDPYYIEITPSFNAGQKSTIPGSYLVVSGTTRGGTSYHNRFVLVPQRLYVAKDQGGAAELVPRRDHDGNVEVVDLR